VSLHEPAFAAAIGELLALASEVGEVHRLGVVGQDGRPVAGEIPVGNSRARQPIHLAGTVAGFVVAEAGANPSLLRLLARAIELTVGGMHEAEARARMAQELAIGRQIQLALIPRHFPEIAGWEFGAAYEAALEVGGDLYDVFTLRGRTDRLGLIVADVTGKGIPAALLMADVRALLHAAADNASGPGDALRRVNRILVGERKVSQFVTAAILVIDTVSGEVRLASAGHEPPLVVRAGTVEPLAAAGPLLGAFRDADFEEETTMLADGDAIVLYTDGVTETRDMSGAFFGEEALVAALAAADGGTAGSLIDAVLARTRAFRGAADAFDDLALLVARRRTGRR
jgi:phosphoserine phosphatase RsbU/P